MYSPLHRYTAYLHQKGLSSQKVHENGEVPLLWQKPGKVLCTVRVQSWKWAQPVSNFSEAWASKTRSSMPASKVCMLHIKQLHSHISQVWVLYITQSKKPSVNASQTQSHKQSVIASHKKATQSHKQSVYASHNTVTQSHKPSINALHNTVKKAMCECFT
jgi:hypothetical protein